MAGALSLAVSITAVVWPGAAAGRVFRYTGAQQRYVVPSKVTVIRVLAVGGKGAALTPDTIGGLGATASATLPVAPGETLYVEVGGNARGFVGGFNGGGPGDSNCCAGGGGGASDVRTVSVADAAS